MDREIILAYAKEKYNSLPDYPWQKYPSFAVLRKSSKAVPHKHKWYALIMNISKRKVGLNSDKCTDFLNVKCPPELIGSFIDYKTYFPAYHMNKEHWLTILLDNVKIDKNVFNLIDTSYELVYAYAKK